MIVAVVSVSVVNAVSRLTRVDVTVSMSVTVVVAGARDSHEEQNDSPTAGSALTAPRHSGEPHTGLVQRALATPARMPVAMQSVQDLMFFYCV